MARGQQVEQLRADLGWCASSIPTVLRLLVYWQSQVKIAPASPDVEARRIHKARQKRDGNGAAGRKDGETLAQFQERVLAELPPDLREQAQAQLGREQEREPERNEGETSNAYYSQGHRTAA